MKPFNLEEAKAGKPVVTVDGDEAIFIAHAPQARNETVVFLVCDQVRAYYANGSYYGTENGSMWDLQMKSREKEIWLNIYTDVDDKVYASGYDSEEKANLCANDRRSGPARKIIVEI